MKIFSYVVARDYGFAPNPFWGVCSLATCKPGIRRSATVGDWVVGTGAVHVHGDDKLVFAMQITEKMTFNDYWQDPRFLLKRPVMNGSLKRMYGDNIYHQENGVWKQADSHHSNQNGSANMHNLRRDTSCENILLAEEFYYFGEKAVRIPIRFRNSEKEHICKRGPGYKSDFSEKFVAQFSCWLEDSYERGYYGDPAWFSEFDRYDGVS